MRIQLFLIVLVLLVVTAGCKNNATMAEGSKQKPDAVQPAFTPGPQAIVFKTRADYSDKVAITLSEDRTKVVAYPHPRDIARENGLPYPTQLAEGYLLDNQGINRQVAYTSYTMEEYAALPEPPNVQELLARVIDKDPLLKMCNCGNRSRYENPVAEINTMIGQGLALCKTLVDKAQ